MAVFGFTLARWQLVVVSLLEQVVEELDGWHKLVAADALHLDGAVYNLLQPLKELELFELDGHLLLAVLAKVGLRVLAVVLEVVGGGMDHLNHRLGGVVVRLHLLLGRRELVLRLKQEIVLGSECVLLELSGAIEVVCLVIGAIAAAVNELSLGVLFVVFGSGGAGCLCLRNLVPSLLLTHLHQLIAVEEVAGEVLVVCGLPQRQALVAVVLLAVENDLFVECLILIMAAGGGGGHLLLLLWVLRLELLTVFDLVLSFLIAVVHVVVIVVPAAVHHHLHHHVVVGAILYLWDVPETLPL